MTLNTRSYTYYLKHFKESKLIPCIYCPGICLTACPTFLSSKNLLLSPFGYVRLKEAIPNCLQCWRCTFNCPVEYPLPLLIEEYKEKGKITPISYKVISEGEKYLVGDVSYIKQMASLARILNIGVISVNEMYSLVKEETVLPFNKDNLIAFSPEAAFLLNISHYSEVLSSYLKDLNFSIKLHIPCLLLPRVNTIIKSLSESGINIIDIDYKTCIKLDYKKSEYYSLCPKVWKYNNMSFDQYLINFLNKNIDKRHNL